MNTSPGSVSACDEQIYKYYIEYDEALLLNPTIPLYSSDISGVVCRGCLTSYIDAATSILNLGPSTDKQVIFNNAGDVGGFGQWDGTTLDVQGNLTNSIGDLNLIASTGNRVGVRGSGPNAVTLSVEQTTNGSFTTDLSGWTSVGWSWNAGSALNTPLNVNPLFQNINISGDQLYFIEYRLSGVAASGGRADVSINGTLVPTFNTIETSEFGPTNYGTFQAPPVGGSMVLAITPNVIFVGALDYISVKQVIGNTRANFFINDAADAITANFQGSAALHNLAIGRDAFFKNLDGQHNIAIGERALSVNVNGFENIAIGNYAMLSNGTGFANVAIGFQAFRDNISGYQNTAVGHNALIHSTGCAFNTAIGQGALQDSTLNYSNTGVGVNACRFTTLGDYNIGVGANAVLANTTGHGNIAVGVDCLRTQSTVSYNNAFGLETLFSNLTGVNLCAYGDQVGWANTTGSHMCAYGSQAIRRNTTGNHLCVYGSHVLYENLTGNNLCVFGSHAMGDHVSGDDTIAIGYLSGVTETPANTDLTGSRNTWIGTESGPGSTTQLVNSIAIGYRAHVSASNEAVFANSSTTRTRLFGTLNINGTDGIDATVALAMLTGGGTNGSMTFVKGLLTAYTAPT